MAYDAKIARLSMELGLAVNDYNSGISHTLDDVIKTTLEYLAVVKEVYGEGHIEDDQLTEFFALVGQSWASIQYGSRKGSEVVKKPESINKK